MTSRHAVRMQTFAMIGTVFLAGCASTRSTMPEGLGRVGARGPRDGVYYGEASSGLVKAWVRVTVLRGQIATIDVMDTTGWRSGEAAAAIPRRIIEAQSTDVDAVTGATATSWAIMGAVQRAVDQAAQR